MGRAPRHPASEFRDAENALIPFRAGQPPGPYRALHGSRSASPRGAEKTLLWQCRKSVLIVCPAYAAAPRFRAAGRAVEHRRPDAAAAFGPRHAPVKRAPFPPRCRRTPWFPRDMPPTLPLYFAWPPDALRRHRRGRRLPLSRRGTLRESADAASRGPAGRSRGRRFRIPGCCASHRSSSGASGCRKPRRFYICTENVKVVAEWNRESGLRIGHGKSL